MALVQTTTSPSKQIRTSGSKSLVITSGSVSEIHETVTPEDQMVLPKHDSISKPSSSSNDLPANSDERYIFTPPSMQTNKNEAEDSSFAEAVNKAIEKCLPSCAEENTQKRPKTRSKKPKLAAQTLPVSKPSSMTLDDMSKKMLEKLILIRHDGNIYYYNDYYYQIIKDDDELLELIRSEISYDAFASTSLSRFPNLLRYFKSDANLTPSNYEEKLRKATYYVAFRNGVLNLNTMELKKHSPKYLVFYMLDADWKPSSEPRYFQKFLQDTSRNDPQIELRIKESLGYLFSSINYGKCFFVMGTAQNSGKSTLGIFIEKVLGKKLVTNKSVDQLSKRFGLGDIHGTLLNLSMDMPNGDLTAPAVSIIKQITGGDSITVERKYDKLREVSYCHMRFLFASNYPVTIPKEDDNDAFWNRMVIIPFLYSVDPSNADPELPSKLLKEKDAIISTCIKALGNVIQNHYIFSPCQAADQLKQSWRYQKYDITRSVPVFAESCLEITENPNDKLYLGDLYQEYLAFCSSHHLTTTTYNSFAAWLSTNLEGCSRKRIHETGKSPRAGLTGIKVKIDPDEECFL